MSERDVRDGKRCQTNRKSHRDEPRSPKFRSLEELEIKQKTLTKKHLVRWERNQKNSVLKTKCNNYLGNKKKSYCQILLRIGGHKNLFGVDSEERELMKQKPQA